MQCILDGCSGKTKTLNSYTSQAPHAVTRRVQCKSCGLIFSTTEIPNSKLDTLFYQIVSAIQHTSNHLIKKWLREDIDAPQS